MAGGGRRWATRPPARWGAGTHSQRVSQGFSGAGQEHQHNAEHVFDADHPAVLVGQDNGPTPLEYPLCGLASCITAGMANITAARGVTLSSVESTVTGDIDLQGIIGMSDEVRNGYEQIAIHFTVEGDAPQRPAGDRRAVPRPFRRLRRAEQRGARLAGHHRLTPTRPPVGVRASAVALARAD